MYATAPRQSEQPQQPEQSTSGQPEQAQSEQAPSEYAKHEQAYRRALGHLATEQAQRGSFGGEVVWNTMLISQYVMMQFVLGRPIAPARREHILTAYRQQQMEDGGFAMHRQSGSYLFHTTLAYTSMRLLGVSPDDPLASRARRWILGHGGVPQLPAWGRVWMALLGLHPWEAIHAIVPELWLLPHASPAHPRKLYCHMRLIYLGLSYLHGARMTAPKTAVVEALRRELFPGGYDPKQFKPDQVATTDLFEDPGVLLKGAFGLLKTADRLTPGWLRKQALRTAIDHMLFELRSTDYVCLSPVNGMLFCLALHHQSPQHPELERALAGLEYWVWEDDTEGMRIAGARSDIWDTSFLLQALSEGPSDANANTMKARARTWLASAQMIADIPNGRAYHRAPARGGWGFADEHHPWPVSDCTAEALEALLANEHPLPRERVLWALEFILARQNPDGGFGSYEARRGSDILRHFNPSELYGSCMIEGSYVECTGSCLRGLASARHHLGADLPAPMHARIEKAIVRGTRLLLHSQHKSGGWAGFWGIHFTYGTFFVVSGLRAAGLPVQHDAFAAATRFLLASQRPDGGWGESFRGLHRGEPVQLAPQQPSSVVQTAWALLTLLDLRHDQPATAQAIERGLAFLCRNQQADGSWPREPASGVFFKTAVLDYKLYRQIFPAWALARALART